MNFNTTLTKVEKIQGEVILVDCPVVVGNCKICYDTGSRHVVLETDKEVREHISVRHPRIPVRYKCLQCGRVFGSHHAFACHIGQCKGPQLAKAFPCARCSMSFDSNRGLGQHSRTHGVKQVAPTSNPSLSRKSSWTEKELGLLKELECRLEGMPSMVQHMAALIKTKDVGQIRARRALSSHKVEVRKFATEKVIERTMEGTFLNKLARQYLDASTSDKAGSSTPHARQSRTSTPSQVSVDPSAKRKGRKPSRKVIRILAPGKGRSLRVRTLDPTRSRVPGFRTRGPFRRQHCKVVGTKRRQTTGDGWTVSVRRLEAPTGNAATPAWAKGRDSNNRLLEGRGMPSGASGGTPVREAAVDIDPDASLPEDDLEVAPGDAPAAAPEDLPSQKWCDMYEEDRLDWLVPPDLDEVEIGSIFPETEDTWDQRLIDKVYKKLVDWLLKREGNKRKRKPRKVHRTMSQPSRKNRKRYAFARTQELMNQDAGLLAKHVCQGTDHLAQAGPAAPREDVEKLYRSLWETKVPTKPLPTPVVPCVDLRPEGFLRPFAGAEVLRRVRKLDRNTAAGTDGIRKDHLNDLSVVSLLSFFFNRVLRAQIIPVEWARNRTTLIPKEGKDTGKATNYRPITIGPLIGRLFWSLINTRVCSVIKLTPRQKGFVQEAGCFNNVQALSEVLHRMKTTTGGVAVQLDVSKAFDTAPHDAIYTALRNKGIPGFFCRMVAQSYRKVTTQIAHSNGPVAVRLLRGVKQGDPLSPLLFNLILEPLLLLLESMEGYRLGAIRLSVLGFADDLFLFANTPRSAQALLNTAHIYLKDLGMSLAPDKSLAIFIRSANGSWSLEDPVLEVDGVPIVAASVETRFRYLGGFLGPDGVVDLKHTEREIASVLDRLQALRLSSTNKLLLLSRHLIPHFLHQLVMALPAYGRLTTIDNQIRAKLRKILHLPAWTSKGLLYAGTRDGGLGLPNLANLVTMVGLRLGQKFKNSIDPLLVNMWPGSQISKKLGAWVARFGLPATYSAATLEQLRADRRERLLARWASLLTQGGAVGVFRDSPWSNLFLQRPHLLSPCRFITALKMRINAVVTRVTLNRTGSRILNECRQCGLRPETLGHIVGYCPYTKAARIRRHNDVRDFVAHSIRTQKGKTISVSVERRFRHTEGGKSENLQPDITVRYGDTVYLVDITVKVEKSGFVEEATRQKERKYDKLLPNLKLEFKVPNAKVLTIVVGTIGAMPNETINNLNRLGILARRDMLTIHLMVLRSTIELYHGFMD